MDKNPSKKLRTTTHEPWNYFPDCHICNAMKQGRGNTEEDLTKVLAEALNNKSRKVIKF